MLSKFSFATCLLLTLVIANTALRIEYLNAEGDYFLPRPDEAAGQRLPKWELNRLEEVLAYINTRIFTRREHSAMYLAGESGDYSHAKEVASGPPYSESEQRLIDKVVYQYGIHTKLLWWVRWFGVAQYVLAPITFLLALACSVRFQGIFLRSTAGLCVCVSALSIFLMLLRGYWTALGA